MSNGSFCEAAAGSVIRTGWEDSPDGRLLRTVQFSETR
jgi:hypothetical protein